MPIHDWTRVRANRFHDFHQSWTVAICHALNAGLLPPDYFAMIMRKVAPDEPRGLTSDAAGYARKANRIAICRSEDDIVAVVEIVSPGNKECRPAIRSLVRTVLEFLAADVNVLIVDLFPPRRRDPEGIHAIIWKLLHGESSILPPDKPLTVVAYAVGAETVAYVEPVAVGDRLPDMPIFLTADRYVPCPLEATYQTAWEQFPAPLRGPLESPPTP